MRGVLDAVRDTQRVYRLYDFHHRPAHPASWGVTQAANVNNSDELHLVIESVRPDARHARYSSVPIPADGAGGKSN